jgi:type II secretory pathway pseudopilin PulG
MLNKSEICNLKSQIAFTLVELLITIGIIILLAAVAAPIYGNLQVSAQLNESTSGVTQTLRQARQSAMSRENNAGWGVYFTSSSYTLYQGISYAARNNAYDLVISLDSALSFSTTLAGDEVNFSAGLGEPSNTGSITLTHDVNGTRTITINSLGSIEEE